MAVIGDVGVIPHNGRGTSPRAYKPNGDRIEHLGPDRTPATERTMRKTLLPEHKVFCVGFGKTGTTSMEAFFKRMGFQVGDQAAGEMLLRDWVNRRFDSIIQFARTAQFFQDVPFSCPFTFQCLDVSFPGSKFILTVRDSEQWYRSLIRFHTQVLGKRRLPTAQDLSEWPYRYKGFMSEGIYLVYGTSEKDPYNKDALISTYEFHNNSVKKYFAHRGNDLLVLDLNEKNAAQQIVEFLGMTYQGEQLPHLNRSWTTRSEPRRHSMRAHQELIAEHNALIRAYDVLLLERDAVVRAQEDLVAERDALARARDDLTAERDALARARDDLTAERDAVAHARDDLAAERDALAHARDDLTAERDALAHAKNNLLAERETLVQGNSELIAARDALAGSNNDLACAHNDLIAERDLIEHARNIAIRERDALLASSSWRLTAPLRRLRRLLPRLPSAP